MRFKLLALVVWMGAAAAALAGPDSGFEVRFDGGLVSPASSGLHQDFISSSSFGGSLGYDFGGVSLLLDSQYDSLDPSNSSVPAAFNALELALLEKARFGGLTSIRPFVFLGEGVAISFLSGSSVSETDPLLEGGVGMDFFANERISLFLQAKADFVMTSSQALSPDKLSVYIPLQVGMD